MVSARSWAAYKGRLSAVNKKAADLMAKWMESNPNATADELIRIAYALAKKYGEAAAAQACQLYDEIAKAQAAHVPAAVPAAPATYAETARSVNSALKDRNVSVPDTVGRLVKQAGADTTLQNASRDRAEYAWIARGDTCAFCLSVAANGWQRAGSGDHADHIHAHCDCEYMVRFDSKTTVEGYDPESYKETYREADGHSAKDKINAIRRQQYAENPEKYLAQKRAAYARRKEASE